MNGEKNSNSIRQKSAPFRNLVVVKACLALMVGCEPPEAPTITKATQGNSQNEQGKSQNGQVRQNPGTIQSDGPITIENGKVTYGRPELTEEREKEIYKSLSYSLRMAESIEKKNPGGNRGSRQSRADFELNKKSFMLRYDLTASEIEAILNKGKKENWK